MTRSSSRAGFTLIEMAVVVLIVALLAGIVVQQYQKAQIQAQAAALSHDLHVLEDEILQLEGLHPDKVAKALNIAQLDAIGERPLTKPTLPEGMRIGVSHAAGADFIGVTLIAGSNKRAAAVLEELGRMRPLTAHSVTGGRNASNAGGVLVEKILLRSMTVQQTNAAPAAPATPGASGSTGSAGTPPPGS